MRSVQRSATEMKRDSFRFLSLTLEVLKSLGCSWLNTVLEAGISMLRVKSW